MVHSEETDKKVDRWRPQDAEQEEKVKKMVLQNGEEESVESLARNPGEHCVCGQGDCVRNAEGPG